MKKYAITGLLLLAGLIAAITWWPKRKEATLVDLQKEILFAKTAADSAQVFTRLQKYYLQLEVPDSLADSVANDVSMLLDTTKLNREEIIASIGNDENVYKAEIRLQSALKSALIARAQGHGPLSSEVFSDLELSASQIDSGLGVNYWGPFLAQASRFTPEQARFWLKAKRAEALCYDLHNKSKLWENGEKYGALSLQYLEHVPDERLRLDIAQRLQVILYDYRGLTDLSFLLAQRAQLRAKELCYPLRATGILYNYANARHSAGQDQTAFKLFLELIEATEKYRQVPQMAWYRRNGFLHFAGVYWQLGRYSDALRAAGLAEQLQLMNAEIVNLHIVRGVVQLRLGNYDLAEAEYRAALVLAHEQKSYDNEVRAYNNLGSMFFNLKEYEKAQANYRYAHELLQQVNPGDFTAKVMSLCNMAEVLAARGEVKKVQELVAEADDFIQTVSLVHLKAQLLRNLGKLSLQNHRHEEAAAYFEKAAVIYEENGLLRSGLENKLYLADCDRKLQRYTNARARLAEALAEARQINEPERIIDAYGMLAEIAQAENNLENAVSISNQLINEVEALSSRPSNSERLVLYRHKIDEYLKNAVLYEIQQQRLERAWEKLDYEKGRALKAAHHSYHEGEPVRFVSLDEAQHALDAQSVLIDYLTTPDTLYAFILEANERRLLRKPIDLEDLKNRVTAYNDAIRNTAAVFSPYNPSAIKKHFDMTTALGQRLYKDLMVWPDFELDVNEERKLYLIPDVFLHEVPFSTLVIDTLNNAVTFVVQAAAVVNMPSLSFLIAETGSNNKFSSQTAKVLLSADPAFEKSPALVQAVKKHYPGTALLETSQSRTDKDAVLNALAAKSNYDLQLYACHSVSNNEDPDLSFVTIAIRNQASDKTDTIAITFADLKKLPGLAAQFVLLVGCETAQGKLFHGTGLVGLQHGFLSLGAKRVQASLWRIPAEEAIPQTQDLLVHWAQASPSVWALREIQLKYIAKYSNGSIYLQPHPYLWGSYVLVTTMNEN